MPSADASSPAPSLDRTMGLLQATATNVISMVGVGPFLTIPFMVAAMNGPHVIYAWLAGLVLAMADGMVYAQLGAAIPGSGGGYQYLREAFQPFGLGRMMSFLFIFQTLLVAPLSVASGAVGFADYLQFLWTSMTPLTHHLVAAASCLTISALLWRHISGIGRLAVVMLVVVLGTVGWVIVAGLFNFSPAQAFDFPPEAFAVLAPRPFWRCTATAVTTRSATSATKCSSRRGPFLVPSCWPSCSWPPSTS
jgi:amino acid transporter